MVTCLSLDWTKLVSGSRDGTARVWDVMSGRQLGVCRGHTDCVIGVGMHDSHIVTASWDGDLRCWFP